MTKLIIIKPNFIRNPVCNFFYFNILIITLYLYECSKYNNIFIYKLKKYILFKVFLLVIDSNVKFIVP